MSNAGMWIVTLGKDPEVIKVGERELLKLRCAEKGGSKKAITRWFTALCSGPDVSTYNGRLGQGDTIALSGELLRVEYTPKNGPKKGVKQEEDEMSYAKIVRVIRSKTFFEQAPDDAPEAAAPAFNPDDVAPPDLEGL